MDDKRKNMVQGLRQLADFLEKNEAVPLPYATLDAFVSTKAEFAACARAGRWNKQMDGTYAEISMGFGDHVLLRVNVKREQVCEKKIVGQRIVPAVPAQPERTEDIVEWECHSILGE